MLFLGKALPSWWVEYNAKKKKIFGIQGQDQFCSFHIFLYKYFHQIEEFRILQNFLSTPSAPAGCYYHVLRQRTLPPSSTNIRLNNFDVVSRPLARSLNGQVSGISAFGIPKTLPRRPFSSSHSHRQKLFPRTPRLFKHSPHFIYGPETFISTQIEILPWNKGEMLCFLHDIFYKSKVSHCPLLKLVWISPLDENDSWFLKHVECHDITQFVLNMNLLSCDRYHIEILLNLQQISWNLMDWFISLGATATLKRVSSIFFYFLRYRNRGYSHFFATKTILWKTRKK